MDKSEPSSDITALAAEITAAYVENNEVGVETLPDLIRAVYGALNGLGVNSEEPTVEEPKPSAYQVRKSISDGGLVSFIDGRTYKTHKRHLGTHEMSGSYPMVAPAYTARRSELTKASGLGSRGQQSSRRKSTPNLYYGPATPKGRDLPRRLHRNHNAFC